ncbi:hypothetical protein [Stenotrophomonas acidaminiphila]|uniref:hypothetical protein n=1 Tax=Stenotrophomonas acidaminiphila TaxID=128780 RepID=UPI00137950D8|nr:hypothetical protein [Stenotrophomonas acidaminiphila]
MKNSLRKKATKDRFRPKTNITLMPLVTPANSLMYKLAIERSIKPNRHQKSASLIASDKFIFSLRSSNKKPRRCGASWYNIIALKLAPQLLWS